MGAKQFVLDTLGAALKIIDGEYDREKDWELFILARQSILASIEFVRAEKVDVDKIAKMTLDDFMDWLHREDIYFYRNFPANDKWPMTKFFPSDVWPMTKAEVLQQYREYKDNERQPS